METRELQYSVYSLCRICLIHLEHGVSHNLFLVPGLAKKLCVCTSLSVEQADGFPKNLCTVCFSKLNDLHDFRELCAGSIRRFKEMVAGNRIMPMGVFEPVAEDSVALSRQDEQASFDPLQNNKLEIIDNEEEVFKMLETVDREPQDHAISSSHDGSSTEEEKEENKKQAEDFSSEDEQPLARRRRMPSDERQLNRLITCPICQQKFKKLSKYEEHMKHHNDLLPFQCEEESCRKGFTTAGALRLHVDYAHTKKADEIPCSVEGCRLLFPRLRLLTIHLKKVHNQARVSAPRAEQPCRECGMVFRCPVALKKHMYKHTGEELPYPCNICGKGFHINSALKNHLLRHAGIKNYVCPYCGVGKTTRQEWTKHLLTHTQEKQFKCDICDHATHTKRALDSHVKIVHEKIRNFACQYCGKTFGKSHACKIHEMTHTGEKRCECKVCGKKFLYTESLTKHLKIHEKSVERALETYRQRQGEPDALDSQVDADQLLKVCAESVATIPKDPRRVERVDLAQLAGTVVNPIPTVQVPASEVPTRTKFVQKEGMHLCPGCSQGFNNLGNMKRHYKSVHEKVKDFECRFCSRRFANSQSLKQHEWIHTGEKPYECKLCGTHFRQEAALIRHQKVHDEKPPKPPRPAKQISERARQKAMQKSERRQKVEALRQEIAEAAKEELKDLAIQRSLEKQQNTYEQYQAAATDQKNPEYKEEP
ncbi:zinc finger protein 14 homolog [Drosophila eugracilis]|uniref:zinc finger protein 14 homolog n=1 Tax=Drosophila eugracilis TaxID=29029 RepID=UPI0007E68EEE|nr:zinc finger protein 14 homolog [Drosophila eugracilis]